MQACKCTKVFAYMVTIIFLFSCIVAFIPTMDADAASGDISSLPTALKCYPISTGQDTRGFANKWDSKYSGTAYGEDLCTIQTIDGDGWAYVNYPVSGGKTRTLYFKTNSFFNGANYQTAAITKSSNAYRRSFGSATIGSVGTGDALIYVVGGEINGRYQIVYHVDNSNYYKMGWVPTSVVSVANTSNNMNDVTSSFGGKKITLKSVENGKYLCADGTMTNMPANCNRDSASNDSASWESFEVHMTPDGWCGLLAYNGKWLSARIDITDAPIMATANDLQSWECFRIYQKGSDYFLKCQANDKWACVRVDMGNAPVQAYATEASTWERFAINFVTR